jgi:hypothetical protein
MKELGWKERNETVMIILRIRESRQWDTPDCTGK